MSNKPKSKFSFLKEQRSNLENQNVNSSDDQQPDVSATQKSERLNNQQPEIPATHEPKRLDTESSSYQQPEISTTQKFENLNTQLSETVKPQNSDNLNTQVSESAETRSAKKPPGRPKGKRSNPNYAQVTSYIRKETYKAVRRELLEEEVEFSALVQDLLDKWLEERRK